MSTNHARGIPPVAGNSVGQQFHSGLVLVWAGLGMILGDRLRDWLPDGKWNLVLGMLLILGGGALWVVLWRRTTKKSPT